MATVTVTTDQFRETVFQDGLVLVDFCAGQAGPCQSFGYIYESASTAHPDTVFAKVDTNAEQALSGALGITSVPTLMVFRDGIQLFSEAGAFPEPVLHDIITQAKALDMEAVRAELERQRRAKAREEAEAGTDAAEGAEDDRGAPPSA